MYQNMVQEIIAVIHFIIQIAISSDDKIYVADWGNKIHEFVTGLTYSGAIGVPKSRMDMAKDVIKKIFTTELTSGANFGLMEWGF